MRRIDFGRLLLERLARHLDDERRQVVGAVVDADEVVGVVVVRRKKDGLPIRLTIEDRRLMKYSRLWLLA